MVEMSVSGMAPIWWLVSACKLSVRDNMLLVPGLMIWQAHALWCLLLPLD